MTSLSNRPAWYDAILPVIDLRFGNVVRGIAGRREEYLPVQSRYVDDSRPGSLAHLFATTFGFQDCYVADLNAIVDRQLDIAAIEAIAVQGLSIWLDAGVGSVKTYRRYQDLLRDLCPYRWIVGLESLESWSQLEQLLAEVGPERMVFSLDLKEGQPVNSQGDFAGMSSVAIALKAIQFGTKSLIVLDLASVGVGAGSRTEPLLAALADRCHGVEVIGGGGVRGPADVEQLVAEGAGRVLVASALHDGRIAPFHG